MRHITLFKSITMFHGIDNISQTISHIHTECGKYPKIFCGILSIPHNIVMKLNNAMTVQEFYLLI